MGEESEISIAIGGGNFDYSLWPNNSATAIDSNSWSISPDTTTIYEVEISEGNLCKRKEKVRVVVLSSDCSSKSIYIPNTFTPNGDGKNDVLRVRANYLKNMYFAVYDRWGERVFETNDISTSWDGNFKGMPADSGVYGWYLKGTCKQLEEIELKGNVTIIR